MTTCNSEVHYVGFRIHNPRATTELTAALIQRSTWFECEPLPYDNFKIKTKLEHRHWIGSWLRNHYPDTYG